MKHFVAEGILFGFVKLADLLKFRGILGNQGTLLQQRNYLGQIRIIGELFDVFKQRGAGNSGQGVLDSGGISESIHEKRADEKFYLAVMLRCKLTDCWRAPREASVSRS